MSKKVRDVTHPQPFYIIHSEVRQQAIVCGLFYEIVKKTIGVLKIMFGR